MEFEIRLTRVADVPFSADAIRRHIAGLAALDDAGLLIAAGPLADGSGGLILARFDSQEDAESYANADAFVGDGYETAEVRQWLLADRANNYLGP